MTEPESFSVPAPPGAGTEPVAPGGAPLAEAWTRFVAYLIDALVLGVIMLVPGIVFVAVLLRRMQRIVAVQGLPGPDHRLRPVGHMIHQVFMIELLGLAILLPLSVVASYLYHVTLPSAPGQTAGKRTMKIKVVRALDGGPISVPVARRRWVASHLAPMLAPYYAYADALWLLWDKPYRQCLHDKCAETVVVKSTS